MILASGRAARRASGGFTLIELMVAAAIFAILTAVALPLYRSQVMRANRIDAVRTLTSYRQALERCYSQNFTYLNAAPTPCPAATGVPTNSANGYYSITFPGMTATSYTIVATPNGTQVNDVDCASMQVTNAGAQSALSATGTDSTQTCWGGH
jgi:type IV pilus assembly protein PilE